VLVSTLLTIGFLMFLKGLLDPMSLRKK